MDDLIAFLRARLDEDERKVAAMEREQARVQTAPVFQAHPPNWLTGVDIFVSPKRWRAEVEVKRKLIELYLMTYETSTLDSDAWTVMKDAMRTLAQPYAEHPAYRPEWRP